MKPFLSGRPQHDEPALARDALSGGGLARLHPTHASESGHASNHAVNGQAVECVKQGDKVVRIIVTCNCGERIEIDCLYPNPS